jgi:hypothetical protein
LVGAWPVSGENAIILAGQAIRGVALGVGVTAIVQTVLGGIGLAVAGVPFASLLSAVMLMLCIAQVGPMLVLLPAVGWMYWTGDTGWATFLLVWSLIVGSLDNFLRPMLIKRGADLPLLLIFAGVIGGMLGFGLIGIFVGPVVLAVTYTLMLAWIEDALGKDEPEPPGRAFRSGAGGSSGTNRRLGPAGHARAPIPAPRATNPRTRHRAAWRRGAPAGWPVGAPAQAGRGAGICRTPARCRPV